MRLNASELVYHENPSLKTFFFPEGLVRGPYFRLVKMLPGLMQLIDLELAGPGALNLLTQIVGMFDNI